jgi:hypothetical protein
MGSPFMPNHYTRNDWSSWTFGWGPDYRFTGPTGAVDIPPYPGMERELEGPSIPGRGLPGTVGEPPLVRPPDITLQKFAPAAEPFRPTVTDPNVEFVKRHVTMQVAGGGMFPTPVGPTLGMTTVRPMGFQLPTGRATSRDDALSLFFNPSATLILLATGAIAGAGRSQSLGATLARETGLGVIGGTLGATENPVLGGVTGALTSSTFSPLFFVARGPLGALLGVWFGAKIGATAAVAGAGRNDPIRALLLGALTGAVGGGVAGYFGGVRGALYGATASATASIFLAQKLR